MFIKTYQIGILGMLAVVLGACTAGPDNTGLEYAPQMYHSTPYEPLSQIQDKEIGGWLDSNPEDEHGEFYNSNEYNAFWHDHEATSGRNHQKRYNAKSHCCR